MKKLLVTSLLLVFSFGCIAMIYPGDTYAATRVKGYTKKSGKYVAPHFRSNKNTSKWDNYSYKGNKTLYRKKGI